MQKPTDNSADFEDRVIVVGVGLIGGSVAAAVRQRYPNCEVIGVGRSGERLKAAEKAGLLTEWATEFSSELLSSSAVVVNCLPVSMIADSIRQIASLASDELVITDAGSVKASICDPLQADPKAQRLFVPAHPIAGGEQGGFEYADPDLFVDRVCVVMEMEDPQRVRRVENFWKSLGSRIVRMSADDHDRVLALTSHLPHVMAVLTTLTVGEENFALTGSGFRDTTRVAAGSASLWTAILAGNRSHVIDALRSAESTMKSFIQALADHDDLTVQRLLQDAADSRQKLN